MTFCLYLHVGLNDFLYVLKRNSGIVVLPLAVVVQLTQALPPLPLFCKQGDNG